MAKVKSVKPNCYECRWRGHLAGSCHSKCCHPATKEFHANPMLALFGTFFAPVGRAELPPMYPPELEIEGNECGIRNGWFHYPFNFDPVWLDKCKGFEKYREDEPRVVNNCEQPYYCESCPQRFKCFTERGKDEEK